MKKTILCFAVIFGTFISCKKDMVSHPEPSITQNITSQRVIPNGNLENYIHSTDPELEKLNSALFKYLIGMKKVFDTDENILIKAITKMKAPYQNALFLHKFIYGSGACKTLFNGQVSNEFPELISTDEHCCKLIQEMHYKNVNYVPTLFLYNAERVDYKGTYFLAFPVDANDPGSDDKELIPALKVKKNGQIQTVLLSENQAYYSKEPVIIIEIEPNGKYNLSGNGPYTEPPLFGLDPEGYNPNAGSSYTPPPTGNKWPSGPSSGTPIAGTLNHEYAHLYAHHEANGPSKYACSYEIIGSSPVFEQEIAMVPRNYVDCGCYYPINRALTTGISNSSILNFVTYEHDWWVGYKTITNGLPYPNKQELSIKATTSSDIYAYGFLMTISSAFSGSGSNITFNNGPALHNIKRY